MQQIGSPRRFVQLTLNTYTFLSSVASEWKRCSMNKIAGNGHMPQLPGHIWLETSPIVDINVKCWLRS
jgi:hypothetical protein